MARKKGEYNLNFQYPQLRPTDTAYCYRSIADMSRSPSYRQRDPSIEPVALNPKASIHLEPEPSFFDQKPFFTEPAEIRQAISNQSAWLSAQSELSPLDRFTGFPERHERIAHSLTRHFKCPVPWKDYVPEPASRPGSPGLSIVTTESISSSAPIAQLVESIEMVNRTYTGTPQGPSKMIRAPDVDGEEQAQQGPMDRYLADVNQSHEWLALVLEKSNTAPVTRSTTMPNEQPGEKWRALILDGPVTQSVTHPRRIWEDAAGESPASYSTTVWSDQLGVSRPVIQPSSTWQDRVGSDSPVTHSMTVVNDRFGVTSPRGSSISLTESQAPPHALVAPSPNNKAGSEEPPFSKKRERDLDAEIEAADPSKDPERFKQLVEEK